MYFDRMDVIEAWFIFLCHYHEGQGSKKYRRLCKLLKYFKPSPIFKFDSLSENGKEIYNHLTSKEAA